MHRLGPYLKNRDRWLSHSIARKLVITNFKQLEPKKNAEFYEKNYCVNKRIFVKFINKVLPRWRDCENSRVLPSIRSQDGSSSRMRTLSWNCQGEYFFFLQRKNKKMKNSLCVRVRRRKPYGTFKPHSLSKKWSATTFAVVGFGRRGPTVSPLHNPKPQTKLDRVVGPKRGKSDLCASTPGPRLFRCHPCLLAGISSPPTLGLRITNRRDSFRQRAATSICGPPSPLLQSHNDEVCHIRVASPDHVQGIDLRDSTCPGLGCQKATDGVAVVIRPGAPQKERINHAQEIGHGFDTIQQQPVPRFSRATGPSRNPRDRELFPEWWTPSDLSEGNSESPLPNSWWVIPLSSSQM